MPAIAFNLVSLLHESEPLEGKNCILECLVKAYRTFHKGPQCAPRNETKQDQFSFAGGTPVLNLLPAHNSLSITDVLASWGCHN